MIEAENASFLFDTYKIVKFSFVAPRPDMKMAILFNPKGIYSQTTGKFVVTLDVQLVDSEKNELIIADAKVEAYFKFKENIPFSDIPDFFYLNSVAILFPYIRAFFSTLTLQANIKPVVLPLLNLTELKGELKSQSIQSE